MEEKIKELVNPAVKELNMFVSGVYYTTEEGVKNLNVELDSNDIIDVEMITKASKIINPIIDKMDIKDNNYVLDIHSKEKGVVEDE